MMLDSLNCPSCHASLDLPENLTQPIVKCPYCSTTVIVPEELRQSQKRAEGSQSYDRGVAEILELIQSGNKIEAIKQYRQLFNVGLKEAKDAVDALEMNMVGAVYMPSTAVQRGSSCLGGLLALVLILGAIGAAAFFFLRPSISTISNIDEAVSLISESVPTQLASVVLNGPELLLPVGDGALADVAYTSRDYNQEAMWVNAFSGTAGQAAWQSEPLNDELGNQLLFADDRHVYYVSENKLMALDRADGRTVWQTTLSDRLPYTCGDCILSFGDRLVVQTLDNKLHGLDATTGEEGWAVSLDSSSGGQMRVGPWTAVLADNPETGGGLDLYDPVTGSLAQRIEPRCPHPNFDPQEPSFTDLLLVDENEQSVYFIFGFFDPICIQKWDYAANTQTWNTFIEQDLPPSDAAFVQDANNLYYNTTDHQLFAAAKSDGTVTMLAQDNGYTLVPQTSRSNVLLVKAIRSVGSSREELWGVDAVNGGVLWKFVPQAEEEMVPGSLDVVYESDEGFWTAQPTLSGVRLLQARPNPPRLVVETLGLQDGASSGQKEISLNVSTSSSYWISLLGWEGDVAWLEADLKQFTAVNTATAEVVLRAP